MFKLNILIPFLPFKMAKDKLVLIDFCQYNVIKEKQMIKI